MAGADCYAVPVEHGADVVRVNVADVEGHHATLRLRALGPVDRHVRNLRQPAQGGARDLDLVLSRSKRESKRAVLGVMERILLEILRRDREHFAL